MSDNNIQGLQKIIISTIQKTLSDPLSIDQIPKLINKIGEYKEIQNEIDTSLLQQKLEDIISILKVTTINQLIKEIESKNIVSQSKFMCLNTKRQSQFNTRMENIMEKLKYIKEEALLHKDKAAALDIEWIARTLNDVNIYEIDPIVVNNNELKTKDGKNGLDYLMVYSRLGEQSMKNEDFKFVRAGKHKSKTYSQYDNDKILEKSKIGIPPGKRKESSLDFYTNILSPSLTAKIITLLTRLEYPDFNIFEMNELLQENSSVVIANEIMKRIGVFRFQGIEPGTLKNFINSVVKNYSRKNAVYHNDLHATDVCQTVFTMIQRGDLQKVK